MYGGSEMKRYLNTIEEIAEALQNEKVVFIGNDDNQLKLVNGIMFKFNGKITINPSILFEPNHIYTYDVEPLKLEVGKFYKTRDGKKAFVYAKFSGVPFPFYVVKENSLSTYNVDIKGRSDFSTTEYNDLVAPWEE